MYVYDENGDGMAWEQFAGLARIKSNADMAMDDWMITPPIRVKGGEAYRISLDYAAWDDYWPEVMEVWVGSESTLEGMTRRVFGPVDVKDYMPTRWEYVYAAPEDGTFSIGIHGVTPEESFYLTVDNLEVSTGIPASHPAAVTDLTAVPDELGNAAATLCFTTPFTDYAGEMITSVPSVIVRANGQLMQARLTDAPVEVEMSLTVENCPTGEVTFEVITCGADGTEGFPVTTTAIVGPRIPVAPTDVTAVYDSEQNLVTMRWSAPTTDTSGLEIAPEAIRYAIVNGDVENLTLIADNITGTECSFTPQFSPGTQAFMIYGVYAYTGAGYRDISPSNIVAVGTPYTMPYSDPLDGQPLPHVLGFQPLGDATDIAVGMYSPAEVGVTGTDGMVAQATAGSSNQQARFFSGMIAMPYKDATIGIDVWGTGSMSTTGSLELQVTTDGLEWHTLQTINLRGMSSGWNHYEADLAPYYGAPWVRYGILLSPNPRYGIIFDNITLTGQDGITDVESAEAEPVYYNLQGIRIPAPRPGEIIIEARGATVKKVIK